MKAVGKIYPAILPAIGLLFGSNASVLAATRYVDINNAAPQAPYTNWVTAATNIQDAVDAAAAGETVLVGGGIYSLTTEVSVVNAIRIESTSGAEATVVVAINSNRCFNLVAEAFLGGFSITNGYAATSGGGVLCADESAAVSNCIFAGNTAGNEGGGIYSGSAHDCDFIGNNSLSYGGGTFNTCAYNCTYIDNMAIKGGGFSISANKAIPSNCVFVGNTAKYGGATYGATSVIDCVFSNNVAINTGGAVYQGATAHNCIFAGNIASNKSGGAIYRVYAYDCYFTNNWAHDHGGAIFESGASNCTFIGNHASLYGGAKAYWDDVMQDCVFISNTAGSRGGAVDDGPLQNCIIYSNSAKYGGATYEANLHNCVLYNNRAYNTGGGVYKGFAHNSIIWSNSAPLGSDSYDATIARCCLSDTVTYGSNIDCITNNPQFADAPNGDFHLQPASPCIDAGSNALITVFFDFDGIGRPLDGDANGTAIVDMGSYEFLVPTADSDGDSMPDGYETDVGLNPAVDDASGNPDSDPHDNLAEYIAGTGPFNAADYLRITNGMDAASGYTVEWAPSVSNREYALLWTGNLTNGFQTLESGIEFPQSSYTDTVNGAQSEGFYQIEVQLK